MKLDHGYRKSWRFKIFISGSHLNNWSETVLIILVEGQPSNIPMEFQSHLHKR